MPIPSINYKSVENVPTGKLAGRSTAGVGPLEALTIDASLALATGTLKLNAISGFIAAGSNIIVSGAGMLASPYVISATGAVSSVSNSDGTLTVSPTTGAVVASLNVSHANTWTALQTFGSGVVIASGQTLAFNADAILSRKAAANLQLGAADAAAPVAQTLSAQSVVAGTTNTAGVNLTINGSQGTGTGAGGSIIFQTAPAGLTGTAQNPLVSQVFMGGNHSLMVHADNHTDSLADVQINADAATSKPLVVQGFASQTADLQQWQDSSGNVLASISPILSQSSAQILTINPAKTLIQQNVVTVYGYASSYVNLQISHTPTANNTGLTSPGIQWVAAWKDTNGVVTNPTCTATFIPTLPSGGYLSVNCGGEGLRVWRNENRVPIVGINSSLTTAQLSVIPNWTGKIGIVVQAVAGQTADLQEWQNSSGTPLATVNANGAMTATAFIPAFAKKTAAYTLTSSDNIVTADATTAAFAVTLPAANSLTAGRSFTLKKIDSSANAVTLTAAGTDKIDGAATYALAAQYKYVTVTTDGVSNWYVTANN